MDKNSVENENVGPRVKASSHKTKKRPCGVVHGAWNVVFSTLGLS